MEGERETERERGNKIEPEGKIKTEETSIFTLSIEIRGDPRARVFSTINFCRHPRYPELCINQYVLYARLVGKTGGECWSFVHVAEVDLLIKYSVRYKAGYGPTTISRFNKK
jgi:hypothetical protein